MKPSSQGHRPVAVTGRRERRRMSTEQRILDVALRFISERGFVNTTIDQIAEAADIAKGTFFNYFPNKEHLLMAFGERLVGRLETAAGTFSSKQAIGDQLRAAVQGVAGEWHLRAILGAALSNDSTAAQFQDLLARARENVAVLIREGQQRGEIRNDIPALALARLLQQTMIGTQLVWSLRPASNLSRTINQTLDLFWQGAAPQAMPRAHARSARRETQ